MIPAEMSMWSSPAPVQPEKPHYLHDDEQQPPLPDGWLSAFRAYLLAPALGLLFALGFTAMAFQARASWESHRDWVVPVLVPFLGLGGVAMGYLAARAKIVEMMPGVFFVLLAIGLVAANIWRGYVTEGEDTARNILAILTAVALGLAVLAFVVGLIAAERSTPPAPTSES
jgi:hypothetical protein